MMLVIKRLCSVLAFFALLGAATVAQADAISRYARFTGKYNYVATGGSLRTESNSGNYCAVGSSSSQALSGIPVGSTIVAAYLYWGGSGTTADATVSLNGSSLTASRTFTSTMSDGTGRVFFGGFADVTSRVSGNATMTFGGLTVDTGGQYCSTATVVAGWSLVVVYGSTSEPLRAINIFDGLDTFYGGDARPALTLLPDGFRIPSSGINGKMTAITWDGDPGNSNPLNGFSESLSFNGVTLDDGAVPSGSDPAVQQFDGTITNQGSTLSLTSYGVDVDTYDVTAALSPGQTTATTYYSAGADRVLLTAQIISVTSEPVVDLSITKTHTGNFSAGSNGVFTLHVANGNSQGVIAVDYPVTVTDVLPAGMTFVSGAGSNWSCAAAGQTVTCSHPNTGFLPAGSTLPDIALTVAVGNGVFPNGNTAQNITISNTATVAAAGTVDIATANNSATDTVTVLGSNLNTSTKTVADLNGGDANPGDTLRYTLTLVNSSAVASTGVAVTDHIPGNVAGFSVVSIPGGAINGSSGTGTGANNTGLLNITGITVPASGSVTIVFDVVVAVGTSPGATIDNTATISNPAGIGASPSAAQVVVSQSQIPGSGTKQLYLLNNASITRGLSRTRPAGTHTTVSVASQGGATTWTLTPALQTALTLNGGSMPIVLLLSTANNNGSRTVQVTLTSGATTLASTSQTITVNGTATAFTFNPTLTGTTLPVGASIVLSVTNNTGNNNRPITITPYSGATYSRVELNSATIINVDSVQAYNGAYPAGVVTTSFAIGSTVHVRAVVSDPFGSFDISSATLTLRNPSGTDAVTATAMTAVNDSGAATKTYQYSYLIPGGAAAGVWTARVTANEGVEGITDLGVGTFTVTLPLPTLQVSKVSSVVWDPVNLNASPKRIPGSIVSYTITVSNSGPGSVDASTLVMTDVVPANTRLCVANIGQCSVVQFADGSPVSGLSYGSSNTTYSNTPGGGPPFTYSPTADAEGTDVAVTGMRVAPAGSLSASGGSGNPGFSLSFRLKLN